MSRGKGVGGWVVVWSGAGDRGFSAPPTGLEPTEQEPPYFHANIFSSSASMPVSYSLRKAPSLTQLTCPLLLSSPRPLPVLGPVLLSTPEGGPRSRSRTHPPGAHTLLPRRGPQRPDTPSVPGLRLNVSNWALPPHTSAPSTVFTV